MSKYDFKGLLSPVFMVMQDVLLLSQKYLAN